MPFPPKLLNEGEDVVLDLHPHWWFFVGPLAALFFALIAGGLALADGDLPSVVNIGLAVLIVVCLGLFGARYADWATTNFVVTSDRLIYRHGVISKSGIEIPLDRVNTVFFHQSIFERILGAGDLVIESAGEKGTESFSNVRKPSAVQNEIYKQMEANENRKFDRVGKSGGSQSAAHEIEKLADLRDRGVLSDAEFEAQKARILGS